MTMMDLGSIKKDFSALLSQVQPWTLSHFVMWLDIKVAEYKVFGRMIMDNTPSDTPQWLRASADYLEQQHKEAQAAATVQNLAGVDKDTTSPIPAPPPPALSPRSHAAAAALRPALVQGLPISEAMTTLTTSMGSLYTASTVTTPSTSVSPSVSPAAYAGVNQIRPPPPPAADTFQKQAVPISSPDMYMKSASVAAASQFQAYNHPGSQRIPPISHLSPKHIRQSHMDHNLSMSLPVSLAPVSLNKDISKESLSTAEVESQIAILESQIAAVNRSLKQTAQVTGVEPVLQTPTPPTSKSGRRKADSGAEEHGYGPPPYPKKTRQQSPSSANRASVESTTTLPPLHSSMDMLARIHRLDTDSIPESLRSQNIQSTLEAFEALRTQTFPPNSEVMRTQVTNDVETIQNTAQDMSIHHAITEREQLAAYSASVERDQVYPVAAGGPAAVVREQPSYTPSPTEHAETVTNAAYTPQSSAVHVKVEASQSDEDSVGDPSVQNMSAEEIAQHQAALQNAHGTPDQAYPVSMYATQTNESGQSDDKLAAEISTKKMRRKFLESMKNSNPKYYSHQIQQIIPFPEKFPVANLDYGLKALQMIQTGEITRAGKIQLIDTIFHELIKYTGLYPTPTQKMAVANAIVETFPTLAAKMKASHISPADSWYVILCDKFRNERRGLSGSPRVGRSPKVKAEQDPSSIPADQSAAMEPTEETGVEEPMDDTSQHMAPATPSSMSQTTPPLQQQQHANPPPSYSAESAVAAVAAYQQAYATSQASTTSNKEHALPDMTSEEDEEDMNENEKLVNMNSDERRLYSEKAKRSVRRKTHSPKRVQKAEMPILDERYAASLLEYYSKHKPYYPGVDGDLSKTMEAETWKEETASLFEYYSKHKPCYPGGDGDLSKTMEAETWKKETASLLEYYSKYKPYYPGVDGDLSKTMEAETWKGEAGLVIDEKGGVPATSQALAQAITSHAVGSTDEPYSAEVAAIVQSVVSAHMDEMLAARNYPGIGVPVQQPGPPEPSYAILNQPQEVEGTVEIKTSKKKIKPQPVKTPEQLQVTMQRFKQKLGVTYPGVQVVDDCTLLCTCGTKVKLGRARMLHNYTNYHLKRCQNPPITVTVRHDSHSPSSATPGSIHSLYMGSPGEINIPTTGPKVITKEVESVAYSGLSAADKETIQKHFLLNIPVPSSDMHGGVTSAITDSQSLDLSMPVGGQTTTAAGLVVPSEASNHSVAVSHSSEPGTPVSQPPNLTLPSNDQNILTIPNAGQNDLTIHGVHAAGEVRPSSAPVTSASVDSQSLDLSVQTSGPSVLIEHQPGSDLRVQIPGAIATSIAEYSGELPDLSAINALALIQGKADQQPESETPASEEPINLADS